MSFPSLVGGTVTKEDLVPSIVFAALYGSLIPLAALRFLRKSSRTTLLIDPVLFSIERVVVFSLRAVQAKSEAKAKSHGLTTYEQLTIGVGYISIANCLVRFLRILLVNTTWPDPNDESPNVKAFDQPRKRFWYRRMTGYLSLAFLSATIPGIIAGTQYAQAIGNPATAMRVMRLRYASTGVALFLTATIGIISLIASREMQRVSQRMSTSILVVICCLLSTVSVYRLVVMHDTVDSLVSRGPGSLSSPEAKTCFYVLHMAPEWLAVFILLGVNNRKIFDTGPRGDWRWNDPVKQEVEQKTMEAVKDS